MEKNYYTEGFESFLKEKSDQHKLYPSERVWKNIHRQLHPRNNWPYFVALLLLLGIGITGKYYLENSDLITGEASAKAGIAESNLPIAKHNVRAPVFSIEKNLIAKTGQTAKAIPGNSQGNQLNTQGSPIVTNFDQTSIPLEYPELNNNIEKSFPLSTLESGRLITAPAFNFEGNSNSQMEESAKQDISIDEKDLSLRNNSKNKWDWQLYLSPTVSYRKLSGSASKVPYSYSGIAYSANFGYPSDVNDAVTHTPSIGMELGTAMVYNISSNFRFKAGIQFNYNQYQVKAYSYIPELAPYGLNPNGFIASPLTVVSHYRNFDGYTPAWLKNEHFMVSMPLGLEIGILGNEKVQFSIAGSLQPTYMLNNKAFLISTNLKNYAEESSLYRKWNINTAVETFLSVNTGTVKWVVGPQFRYQLLSSYKHKYPIQEHLLDYGIKVGVNKTLK
jgi:hypothetical protein